MLGDHRGISSFLRRRLSYRWPPAGAFDFAVSAAAPVTLRREERPARGLRPARTRWAGSFDLPLTHISNPKF